LLATRADAAASSTWHVCSSKKWISRTRRNGRVVFVSYRNVFTIWYTFSGRSWWERTQRAKIGYIAVSLVGRSTSGTSSGVLPPRVTQ
jgi:hypothetical protein